MAGSTFSGNVSRPVGGTIRSSIEIGPDGKIDCGTKDGTANRCAEVSYPCGQAVTFTAAADPGFKFVGWFADCDGTAPTCTLDTTYAADKWITTAFGHDATWRSRRRAA